MTLTFTIIGAIWIIILQINVPEVTKTNVPEVTKTNWYSSGYVDPKNNKIFIVNDSLIIKNRDFVTEMGVYCNGNRTSARTWQHMHENDSLLITNLQWQYEFITIKEKVYTNHKPGGFNKKQ